MYEIDATRGYVLAYYNQGEADRRYRILTRDFGVIYAHAVSVRKEQSKLKFFLQKLNLVEVETVQSRKGYQITGGKLIENTTRSLQEDGLNTEGLGVLDRLGQSIGRLSLNSDADSELFNIFEQIIVQLRIHNRFTDEIELWGMGRVLMEFGYFDPAFSAEIEPELFYRSVLQEADLQIIHDMRKKIERYIYQCLEQTML